jgi:hypothetical protein
MNSFRLTRRGFLVSVAAAASVPSTPKVTLQRMPAGGLQPQTAVDASGMLHLLYFNGQPAAGNLFYTTSKDGGETFAAPLQVNSRPGSSIAIGSVRGGHLSLGRDGRVHVAWNGTGQKAQMCYARKNPGESRFEPQQDLIHSAYGLDGGGTVAADPNGNVYVFWHAPEPGKEGEAHRRIWVARSTDDGKTFGAETVATDLETGACGCCGMGAFADDRGVYAIYRSARENVHRDMYLLTSKNGGRKFEAAKVDEWQVGYCVMSTEAFTSSKRGVIAAWETEGQIRLAHVGRKAQSVPGNATGRKHPALAVNRDGDFIAVWTEGTSFKKGGSLAWQVYDGAGQPKGEPGQAPGVPVHSFAAAFAKPDGSFGIVY